MKIKLFEIGRAIRDLQVPEGATLAEALCGIFENAEVEVRVNGSPATRNTELNDQDVVTAIPKMEGGGCK